MYWSVTQANDPDVARVVDVGVGFGPGAGWTYALPDAICGTGGNVDGALMGVAGLRNADRLLPQHIVVSFRWLRIGFDDEGFLAQPFEQTRPARERQP